MVLKWVSFALISCGKNLPSPSIYHLQTIMFSPVSVLFTIYLNVLTHAWHSKLDGVMDAMRLVIVLLPFLSSGLTELPSGSRWNYLVSIPLKYHVFNNQQYLLSGNWERWSLTFARFSSILVCWFHLGRPQHEPRVMNGGCICGLISTVFIQLPKASHK